MAMVWLKAKDDSQQLAQQMERLNKAYGADTVERVLRGYVSHFRQFSAKNKRLNLEVSIFFPIFANGKTILLVMVVY